MSDKELNVNETPSTSSGRKSEASGSKSAPPTRWSTSISETHVNVSQTSTLASTSCSSSMTAGYKTPSKALRSTTNTPDLRKTPHSSGRSGGKRHHYTPKTPSGDERFIPNRSTTKFDVGHFKVMHDSPDGEGSPSDVERQKIMMTNLNGRLLDERILSYRPCRATSPTEGMNSQTKVLSTPSKSPCAKRMRHIPQGPERILDAPEICDDYYLNLIDWSSSNEIAVCLGNTLYLWHASTGNIHHLVELEDPNLYLTAVSFVTEGNYLAVAISNGDVQLWDISQKKRLRTMSHHTTRVASLSWNSYIISSGSRSGHINHYDVRSQNYLISSTPAHTQEVCGLKWSPDGKLLASGGNDNLLKVWPCVNSGRHARGEPLYTFTHHTAAVKALAWCPFQSGLLASGGGTQDMCIKLWNMNTGQILNSINTHSQVCSLLWSNHYRELVSSHGYAHNQLVLWKYPSMTRITELTGHTARVLHMAMSPDGTTIASAAADETLRLWKCFAVETKKKPVTPGSASRDISMALRSCIRFWKKNNI